MRRQISDRELQAFFTLMGSCLWNIQYLEDVLHTLLTLKVHVRERGGLGVAEAMKLLGKQRAATLGNALTTAEKNQALPRDVLERLRALKDQRDWLVHRIQHEDGPLLYTDEGRNAVFERLEFLEENTAELKKAVTSVLLQFCEEAGVDMDRAIADGQRRIDEKRGV